MVTPRLAMGAAEVLTLLSILGPNLSVYGKAGGISSSLCADLSGCGASWGRPSPQQQSPFHPDRSILLINATATLASDNGIATATAVASSPYLISGTDLTTFVQGLGFQGGSIAAKKTANAGEELHGKSNEQVLLPIPSFGDPGEKSGLLTQAAIVGAVVIGAIIVSAIVISLVVQSAHYGYGYYDNYGGYGGFGSYYDTYLGHGGYSSSGYGYSGRGLQQQWPPPPSALLLSSPPFSAGVGAASYRR